MTGDGGARPVRIAPSLLSADFGRLGEEIRAVEEAGAHQLHLDVMDGHYVPNLTFGPMVVAAASRLTSLPLDAHLMIRNAHDSFAAYVEAGASAVAIHPDATADPGRALDDIRARGASPGIAVNPDVPIEPLAGLLARADYAILMSVFPGFGGQKFIEGSFDRLRALRALADRVRPGFAITIDGGMNAARIPEAREAGADVIVAGSAVFGDGDPGDAVRRMLAA